MCDFRLNISSTSYYHSFQNFCNSFCSRFSARHRSHRHRDPTGCEVRTVMVGVVGAGCGKKATGVTLWVWDERVPRCRSEPLHFLSPGSNSLLEGVKRGRRAPGARRAGDLDAPRRVRRLCHQRARARDACCMQGVGSCAGEDEKGEERR